MAKQSMQHGDLSLQATNEYISSHEDQGTPMATIARTLEQNNTKLELGIGGVASGDRPLFLARGISRAPLRTSNEDDEAASDGDGIP